MKFAFFSIPSHCYLLARKRVVCYLPDHRIYPPSGKSKNPTPHITALSSLFETVKNMDMYHVGLLLVMVFGCRILYLRFFNGLYGIPGPLLASVTSLWKFYIVWSESMPWTDTALHCKYGPLVRIGPWHVSASSTEAFDQIYVQKKGFQKVIQRKAYWSSTDHSRHNCTVYCSQLLMTHRCTTSSRPKTKITTTPSKEILAIFTQHLQWQARRQLWISVLLSSSED